MRFSLTTYCSCPDAAPSPTCCREEKSWTVLRCGGSWLADAGTTALSSGGGDPAGGALVVRPYKAEECAGVEWGAGPVAASPALLGLCLPAGRLGCSWNSPPHCCLWQGRPRLRHGSSVRCPDWQEGWSLEDFPALRPLPSVSQRLPEGRSGFH